MLQANTQTDPLLQSDIIALDALFKRIAERGHKIRTQNKTTERDNANEKTLSAELVRAKQSQEI